LSDTIESEPAMLELPAEILTSRRSLLAPPVGLDDTIKSIFWNDTELRAGFRLVIYFLLAAFLGRISLTLGGYLHLPRFSGGDITPAPLLTQELFSLLIAIAPAAILARLESRPFGAYGLPRVGAFGPGFWQGAVWGIGMMTALIGLIRILGGLAFGGLALHGTAASRYALEWGLVFLTVGFFEEFFFRGYTLYTLTTGVGFWPAATILSAIFGAAHLGNKGEGYVGALSVFVIGMFFCLTLKRTGNLWFAVGLHAAFDWGETYLYSVPDSGLVATGHLLNVSFHGPAWITGGTVGPEGSVAAFVVMGLGALIFSRLYPARENMLETQPVSESTKLL
jgi:membrane protease YdiL (CAAX protease family)